jgi:hypothetical protein
LGAADRGVVLRENNAWGSSWHRAWQCVFVLFLAFRFLATPQRSPCAEKRNKMRHGELDFFALKNGQGLWWV